jgi:hypothetical protein
MQPTRWLLATISMVLGTTTAVVALNVALDPYGLYRPTQGRRLVVYGDSRVAKYLLSKRYVPENFDAILIGSSMSANWNLTAITELRVYNASLNGGNVVELRRLAQSALSRPGISTAFLIVHPAMTFSHEFETVRLDDSLEQAALGSLSLWEAYRDMINIRLGRSALAFDEAGTERLGSGRRGMNPTMKRLWRPAEEFDIDPIAHSEYLRLVADLRARGVQLIFIVPPTWEGLLEGKRSGFDKYVRLIRSQVSTGRDEWIDFTSEEYSRIRREPNDFSDGVHLVDEAARRLVAELDARVTRSTVRLQVHGVAPKPD